MEHVVLYVGPLYKPFWTKKIWPGRQEGQGRSKYGTFGSLQWEMCTNALFWPSLTPPANPVKFFWSKMACTCVPHIVLHVSCRTRTSGGYFRPSEVRFRAKIPLSSHWFYNVKTQKTQFLQNSSWEMAEIENIHCPICTQPIPSSWQNGLPPALATDERRGDPFYWPSWSLFMCL